VIPLVIAIRGRRVLLTADVLCTVRQVDVGKAGTGSCMLG